MLSKSVIKKYYDSGFWTKEMVWHAVEKGHISASDYAEITGDVHD